MMLRLAVSAVFVGVTLAACGSGGTAPPAAVSGSVPSTTEAADTDTPSTGAGSMPCGDKITPNSAAAQKLPPSFPAVSGWVATESVTQGKTLVVRGAVKGDSDEIVAVRDAAVAKLTAAGYSRTGGDEEPGFEADADFSGPHPGNINVRALCRDNLVVTYTFAQ